ncbi:hypothetical protein KCU73_g76, partial [Aureobasidium melanogenum]
MSDDAVFDSIPSSNCETCKVFTLMIPDSISIEQQQKNGRNICVPTVGFRVRLLRECSYDEGLCLLQNETAGPSKVCHVSQCRVESSWTSTSTRELDVADASAKYWVLTDLDESLQAVLAIEEGDHGEVAFAKSLCSRRVNAVGFACETQSDKSCVVIVKAEIDRGQPKVSARVLFYRAYGWFTVSRSRRQSENHEPNIELELDRT